MRIPIADHVSVPDDAKFGDSPPDLFCPDCGYDLRGIASERCPECGLAIDRATMSVSRIPWVHRREIGRFRAYWRTTRLAIVHPRRLAEEMNRPVELSDARRFWHVTVLLAWAPLAAWAVGIACANLDFGEMWQGTRLGWFLEFIFLVAALLALWLFLLMASGSASYWFHPKNLPPSRQNRAIALSYYSIAPLGWLWVPAALVALFTLGESLNLHGALEQVHLIGRILAEIAILLIIVACWLDPVLLMRFVTHCGSGRTFAMAAMIPMSWAVVGCVAAIIPLVFGYLSLIVLSFR